MIHLGRVEALCIYSGLLILLEQELVRVVLRIEPFLWITGGGFVLFFLGVALTTGKNVSGLSIGPLKMTLDERAERRADERGEALVEETRRVDEETIDRKFTQ